MYGLVPRPWNSSGVDIPRMAPRGSRAAYTATDLVAATQADKKPQGVLDRAIKASGIIVP